MSRPFRPEDEASVRKHHLFFLLGDDQWARVAHSARKRDVPPGALICRSGEPATHFFLVEAGAVKLMADNDDGQEYILDIVEPGGLFAEAVMFLPSQYPVTAVALKPTRVVAFDCETFRGELRASPDACMALMAELAKRLKHLVMTVRTLTLASAEERVARYLLAQAGSDDRFTSTYPKHVLATRLAMTPESFSRALTKLKRRGLIDVDNREFKIIDHRRLAEDFGEAT